MWWSQRKFDYRDEKFPWKAQPFKFRKAFLFIFFVKSHILLTEDFCIRNCSQSPGNSSINYHWWAWKCIRNQKDSLCLKKRKDCLNVGSLKQYSCRPSRALRWGRAVEGVGVCNRDADTRMLQIKDRPITVNESTMATLIGSRHPFYDVTNTLLYVRPAPFFRIDWYLVTKKQDR